MPIKYNPSKKNTFNGYIDTAVSNLKKAKNETISVLNCDFPTKTIIGRKFNKKGKIYTLKRTIIKDYIELLSTKGEVEKQVEKYIRANRRSVEQMNFLRLTGMPYEAYLETMLRRMGYDYDYEDLKKLYENYRKYRFADDLPEKKKKAWQDYDLLNKILLEYSGVLSSDILLNEKNPLERNSEGYYMEITDKSKDTIEYIGFMENTFTNSSQCQGSVCLRKNIMAICDIDGNMDQGVIKIIQIDPDYSKKYLEEDLDSNHPKKIVRVIAEIPVDGHSNDIEYFPNKNMILHCNHQTGKIEAIYLDENMQVKERKVIRTQQANGIANNKEDNEIILTEDVNVETYSYHDFFSGGTPKGKCLIPDAIKDEKNGIYYNLRGGTTTKDGKLYVCYTGYSEDKRQYDVYGDPPDIPSGTMTAIYDPKTGKCLGRYVNNCNVEVESISFNEKGKLIWTMNGENDTYLLKSNNINEQKMKAKTVKKKQK